MNKGIASLYVMLIFLAASVVAAGLVERQHFELVRTAHFMDDLQMVEYGSSGEEYARQVIHDYLLQRSQDPHTKTWTVFAPPFDLPGALITIRIEDISGRFNVNALFNASDDTKSYFRALCAQSGIDENVTDTLLARMAPLKGDTTPSSATNPNAPAAVTPPRNPPSQPASGGQAVSPPPSKSAPKQVVSDASELVDYGFPHDAYLKLAPYLSALPGSSGIINVNTASETVMKAYLLTDSQISSIRSELSQNGTVTSDALGKMNLGATAITIASNAFVVHTVVTLNGRTMRLASTLWLADNGAANAQAAPAPGTQPPGGAPGAAPAPAQPPSPPTQNASGAQTPPAETSQDIITISRTWGE